MLVGLNGDNYTKRYNMNCAFNLEGIKRYELVSGYRKCSLNLRFKSVLSLVSSNAILTGVPYTLYAAKW